MTARCEVCGEAPERKSLWCRRCNELYEVHLRTVRHDEAELCVWAERGVDYGQPMTGPERAAMGEQPKPSQEKIMYIADTKAGEVELEVKQIDRSVLWKWYLGGTHVPQLDAMRALLEATDEEMSKYVVNYSHEAGWDIVDFDPALHEDRDAIQLPVNLVERWIEAQAAMDVVEDELMEILLQLLPHP